MDNAVRQLEAAKDGAEQWLEDHPQLEANEGEPIEEDEDGPEEEVVTQAEADEREEQRGAVEQFVSELEEAIDQVQQASFPGMY